MVKITVGFPCPKCNAWTRVLRTRGVIRRRECANLHRFTTREVLDGMEKREAADSGMVSSKANS